jgi:hypothetical protein
MLPQFPKISLIGVYLGPFPFYSSLYMKSAGANSGIEFLIFTDQSPPVPLPANVRFLPMDRKAFEDLASEKLGYTMRVASPRKLCDYRPAYGRIFQDYLRNSDYWGHVDLDMVWGNIAKFVRKPLASEYEVISGNPKHLCGPFTIFRNGRKLQELFLDIPDVIEKLNAVERLAMDEKEFDFIVKRSGVSIASSCSFHTRRNLSMREFSHFISDDIIYRRIVKAHEFVHSKQMRLPSLWRSGEVWSCLPSENPGRIRLVNKTFVHLSIRKVSVTVDFENGLVLPRMR